MKSKVSDKDVLQLFTSLKSMENGYPQNLIESRRDNFTKQAAAMLVLMKVGRNGASSTGRAAASTTTNSTPAVGGGMSMSTLLETVLVVALVVEAGVAAYIYRDKIAEFFNSTFRPKVEQTTNPNNNPSPDLVTNDESTAEFTKTPEATLTVTGTSLVIDTPVPSGLINSTSQNNDQNGGVQPGSTPVPTDGNSGLHLGQTKQPTQDPNYNNSNKNQGVSTPAPADGNNGLHLGKTKQPTQESQNNNSKN